MRDSDIKINGNELHGLVSALYPICRSITGDGVRQSLKLLGKWVDLQLPEVPTGTKVFDWEIAKEWNIRGAYIKNSKGEKVVVFHRCSFHVVTYTIGVK